MDGHVTWRTLNAKFHAGLATNTSSAITKNFREHFCDYQNAEIKKLYDVFGKQQREL